MFPSPSTDHRRSRLQMATGARRFRDGCTAAGSITDSGRAASVLAADGDGVECATVDVEEDRYGFWKEVSAVPSPVLAVEVS